jgi:hypothetical protein
MQRSYAFFAVFLLKALEHGPDTDYHGRFHEKGKPAAKRGRKATGLSQE